MTRPINQEFIQELIAKWLLSLSYSNQNSGVYGDWARLIQVFWENKDSGLVYNYRDFGMNESMSKLEILKKLVSFGSEHPAYLDPQDQKQLTQVVNIWEDLEKGAAEWEQLLETKEQELTTERTTTQEALRTGQEWHERQKAEIIAEWKQKLTNLLNTRKNQITQELQLIREVLND